MPKPNFVILYVEDPAVGAAFYAELLDRPALEASPGFAMFALTGGVMLGLWARRTVTPPATASGNAGEFAFTVDDVAAVRAAHDAWRARGLIIAQAPTDLDFGHSFVALDPDSHRLRVFAPAAP